MLVSFWYGKWVAVHEPECRLEIEGECRHDNLFSFLPKELEVTGNIHEDNKAGG